MKQINAIGRALMTSAVTVLVCACSSATEREGVSESAALRTIGSEEKEIDLSLNVQEQPAETKTSSEATTLGELPDANCTDLVPADKTAQLGNYFGTYQCALAGVPNATNTKLCACPTKVVKSGAYVCTLVGSCGKKCS